MARKTSSFSVTRVIAEKRENLASARAELAMLQDKAHLVRAALHFVNKVADHANAIGFTKWQNLNVWTGSAPEVSVTIEGYVSSLKQGAVVEILDNAMACGFEAIGSEDYLNSWASQRNFKFQQNVAGVDVTIRVVANINDSEVCRKVQTGTKLVETPVYEIVCA